MAHPNPKRNDSDPIVNRFLKLFIQRLLTRLEGYHSQNQVQVGTTIPYSTLTQRLKITRDLFRQEYGTRKVNIQSGMTTYDNLTNSTHTVREKTYFRIEAMVM